MTAHLPSFLKQRGWSRDRQGYLIFTGRVKDGPKRGARAAREAIRHLYGGAIPADLHVCHQPPFNKQCAMPELLYVAPAAFNPSSALHRRDSRGRFLASPEASRKVFAAIAAMEAA